jgi:SAM-dependent methyltransferase
MTDSGGSRADGYETSFEGFDSPLMRQIRREAYGEDIGQHSWVGAGELRDDAGRLRLSSSSRLLDLGCGPCGPLTFIIAATGCRGTGVELSRSALGVGRARSTELEVESRLTTRELDLNEPLPFGAGAFDAAMSLDVVLHLRDRSKLFAEVARILSPGARFLFTDAGIVTGAVSGEEVRRRSLHGYTQFVAPGWNERLLEAAGFRLLETEDRTSSVLRNARGRLEAMEKHRAELERAAGAADLPGVLEYLRTVIALSRRRALSRIMYLAESPGGEGG